MYMSDLYMPAYDNTIKYIFDSEESSFKLERLSAVIPAPPYIIPDHF